MRTAAMIQWWMTFLFVTGPAARMTGQDLVLTEADNGSTVTALVDQSIVINLRGNPSTGFTWQLMSTNGDAVIPTGPLTYTPDPGGGPGSPGTFSLPFRAVHAGATTLTLAYVQPWDPAGAVQTFSATIVVAEGLTPRLSITLTATDVLITWPQAGSADFYLEGSPGLFPSAWAALNVLPLPVGSDYQVTLPASDRSLFFRLRR